MGLLLICTCAHTKHAHTRVYNTHTIIFFANKVSLHFLIHISLFWSVCICFNVFYFSEYSQVYLGYFPPFFFLFKRFFVVFKSGQYAYEKLSRLLPRDKDLPSSHCEDSDRFPSLGTQQCPCILHRPFQSTQVTRVGWSMLSDCLRRTHHSEDICKYNLSLTHTFPELGAHVSGEKQNNVLLELNLEARVGLFHVFSRVRVAESESKFL